MIALAQWHWYYWVMNNDGKFKKGLIPWNKGKTGYMGANRTSFKKGDNVIPLEIRFWKKVNKTDTCWLWTGSKNNMGYPRININGNVKLAHRISYEMKNGSIENSLRVLHKCGVAHCVNPEHLFLGTQKDNMVDMSKKSRWGNQYHKRT